MKMDRVLNIKITNIDEAQAIAIEDLLAVWVALGNIGSSRWTSFFADGDGNFRPQITVNGEKPQTTDLLPRPQVWSTGDYKIDFDHLYGPLRAGQNEKK